MSSTGATISDDVITLILLRLPLKSIFRCRCVSRPWNSLISDPLFRKTYLAARPSASPSLIGFFQWFFNNLNENITNTMIVSPEELRDPKRILFLPASDPSCVLDPSVGELKILRGCVGEYNVIAGPSNGLIVVSGSSRSKDLRVYNPLTREVFNLPKIKDWRRESWMKSFVGFYSEDKVSMRNDGSDVGGSCCVSQRYKIVVANVGYYGVQRTDRLLHVNIFCSERGSWRKACLRSCSSFEIMVQPCGSLGGGLFYWHCLRDKFIVFDPNRVRFTRPKKRARHSMDVQLPVIDKPDGGW
ncbi:hypothetical protein Droror1_Dr00001625 [Drosera rotundifolia]